VAAALTLVMCILFCVHRNWSWAQTAFMSFFTILGAGLGFGMLVIQMRSAKMEQDQQDRESARPLWHMLATGDTFTFTSGSAKPVFLQDVCVFKVVSLDRNSILAEAARLADRLKVAIKVHDELGNRSGEAEYQRLATLLRSTSYRADLGTELDRLDAIAHRLPNNGKDCFIAFERSWCGKLLEGTPLSFGSPVGAVRLWPEIAPDVGELVLGVGAAAKMSATLIEARTSQNERVFGMLPALIIGEDATQCLVDEKGNHPYPDSAETSAGAEAEMSACISAARDATRRLRQADAEGIVVPRNNRPLWQEIEMAADLAKHLIDVA